MLGAGGIIRDHTGNWFSGYSVFLGSGNILKAELWSILHGLQLAKDLNITHIVVETDSSLAVQLLTDPNTLSHHHLFSLIHNCRCFLQHFEEASIRHIFREANQPTDSLANWARSSLCPKTIFSVMPSFIYLPCLYDFMQISVPRTCNTANRDTSLVTCNNLPCNFSVSSRCS